MAAASTVMDKMQRALGLEVQDIFRGEKVESMEVGSEVVVVFVQSTGDRAEVEATLEDVVGLMNIFPVGEGEDLSTMEQISRMNVAIIALVMAGYTSRFSNEGHRARLLLTCCGKLLSLELCP